MYPPARLRIQSIWWLTVACGLGLWLPTSSPAQRRVSSEKKALPELGDRPGSVLRVENLKGTLKRVDLTMRTVIIENSAGESVLAFPTAAGREKITLSKKPARQLGKKSLRLEEVGPGWRVKVAYYPTLGTILEIVVEELAP